MTPFKALVAALPLAIVATLTLGAAPSLAATTPSNTPPLMVLARDYCVVHPGLNEPSVYVPLRVVSQVIVTCAEGWFVSVAGPNTTPHVKPPYVVQVRDFRVGMDDYPSAVQVDRFGVVSCKHGTLVTVAVHG